MVSRQITFLLFKSGLGAATVGDLHIAYLVCSSNSSDPLSDSTGSLIVAFGEFYGFNSVDDFIYLVKSTFLGVSVFSIGMKFCPHFFL